MKIDHIALWSPDIEKLKNFYTKYFYAISNKKYINQEKAFQSYFLSFDDGSRVEIMQMPGIPENKNNPIDQNIGLIHFAISLGSEEKVIQLTSQLKHDGYTIVNEPRKTGDGYFESAVLDPDQNRIEIMA